MYVVQLVGKEMYLAGDLFTASVSISCKLTTEKNQEYLVAATYLLKSRISTQISHIARSSHNQEYLMKSVVDTTK
jgi:hypothetical protein